MKKPVQPVALVLFVAITVAAAAVLIAPCQITAQQSPTANSVVPNLVQFGGVLRDETGKPLSGVVGVTFLLYKEQQGGAPLWVETQNVQPDKNGRYSVMLGSISSAGLPSYIFVAGEARWLAVQAQGQPEQPRVMLLSVPYALKAGDADTLGGMPASSFVLAVPIGNGTAAGAAAGSTLQASVVPNTGSSNVTTTGGTVNKVPLWTTATNIQSSAITQAGSGASAKIGVNTAAPVVTLDVNGAETVRGTLTSPPLGAATAAGGKNSQAVDMVASSFSSATQRAVNQAFQWQAEPATNNTTSPSGTLNLLFGANGVNPTETGLKISNNGMLTFATGQTFPGVGTVTSVASGAGLTGGPITSHGTLRIATGGVLNTMLQNSSLTVAAGAGLTGGGAVSLGGSATLSLAAASCPAGSAAVGLPLTCSPFASLGANSFSGSQAVTGNLSGTNEVSAGGLPSGKVASGTVEVDAAAHNNGGLSPGLNFAGGGEAIISDRAGSTNKFGLDFFTNSTSRLSITNAGLVAIGSRTPSHMFEVWSPSDSSLDGAIILGAPETGTGFAAGNGIFGTGGNDTSNIIDNLAGTGGGFSGGTSTIGSGGDGLHAAAGGGPLGFGYAGSFAGDVNVTGAVFAGTKDFRIDHPLEPANKYLVHASVESSEMMNIYTGNVATDAQGEAIVQLPDWFEALNTDFRYQLTVIGQFAQAIVAQKINNHRFIIRTSVPNIEVSWQVTGVRQDAYAKAHPLVVEQPKEAKLQGFYIHPELYGAPPEKQIEWGRHPLMMKRMKAQREGPPAAPPQAQQQRQQQGLQLQRLAGPAVQPSSLPNP